MRSARRPFVRSSRRWWGAPPANSNGRRPLSVRTTYLGLHALPREYAQDRQAYVDLASGAWLEAIAAAGNASDEIKAEAQAETLSNDDDGFAAAIDRYRRLNLYAIDPMPRREGVARLQEAMHSGGVL